MDCIFCKIVNNEIPSYKVYEDEQMIGIMDTMPTVDGHVLLIPKKHYDDYLNIPNNEIKHIYEIAQKMGPKFMNKLDKDRLTIQVNFGNSQVIKHFHMHLLPGYQKDNEVINTVEESYSIVKE